MDDPLAVLTVNERKAWELAGGDIPRVSQRTAALALGISRSALQSRLENARRKLAIARKENAA